MREDARSARAQRVRFGGEVVSGAHPGHPAEATHEAQRDRVEPVEAEVLEVNVLRGVRVCLEERLPGSLALVSAHAPARTKERDATNGQRRPVSIQWLCKENRASAR